MGCLVHAAADLLLVACPINLAKSGALHTELIVCLHALVEPIYAIAAEEVTALPVHNDTATLTHRIQFVPICEMRDRWRIILRAPCWLGPPYM
jgi:hypothetical protein